MNKTKGLDFIKRYTMILVLIVVTAFFAWRTGGAILLPMNVSSLISQNAYVFILATSICPLDLLYVSSVPSERYSWST